MAWGGLLHALPPQPEAPPPLSQPEAPPPLAPPHRSPVPTPAPAAGTAFWPVVKTLLCSPPASGQRGDAQSPHGAHRAGALGALRLGEPGLQGGCGPGLAHRYAEWGGGGCTLKSTGFECQLCHHQQGALGEVISSSWASVSSSVKKA